MQRIMSKSNKIGNNTHGKQGVELHCYLLQFPQVNEDIGLLTRMEKQMVEPKDPLWHVQPPAPVHLN